MDLKKGLTFSRAKLVERYPENLFSLPEGLPFSQKGKKGVWGGTKAGVRVSKRGGVFTFSPEISD